MTNKSSREYIAFADNFEKQMNIVYANLAGYKGMKILELLSGSIRVRYRIIVVIAIKDKHQKTTRVKVEIVKKVIKRAQTGYVENLQVDSSPEAMEIDTPPPTPSELKLSKTYEDADDFNWKKPEYFEYFAVQGYVIEYWQHGSSAEKTKTDTHKSDSLQIQGLHENTGYTAHVMAVNKNGNSEESESVSFKTLKRSLKDWEISLIASVCVIVFMIIIAIVVWCCWRKKANQEHANRAMFPMNNADKYKQDVGVINMAEIPVPSSNRNIDNNQQIHNIVYEEPSNDGMTSSSSHADTSSPYDMPDIQFVNDTSSSTPRAGHYQELNIDNTASHDYQSLQCNRTAVVNPTFIQSEASNLYEPLRKKKESQYQQLTF